jgi:hypothetical protein
MWGNRLGWGISAAIILFACFIGYLIEQAGLPTPPTGWVTQSVHPLETPADANQVVPGMTGARDAGDFYRQAIADYQSSPSFYDQLAEARDFDPAVVAQRPGLKALLDAATCSTMNLFQATPQDVVNYESERAPLEAIEKVGMAAARIALLAGVNKDVATAKKYDAAVFSLGLKLYQERVVYDELLKGEGLMGVGAGGLQRLAERAKDSSRADVLKNFDDERVQGFKDKIEPVWAVISSIADNSIAIHAGDMFALVKDKNVDHLWRVEAALKIGRLKYNANRRGDQLLAQKFLRERAEDPMETPAIRAAAAQARDLTIEQYRQLR